MENTTYQFAKDNLDADTDPDFVCYVAHALKDLQQESPSESLSDLLQEAIEDAYEAWDRDSDYDGNFIGDF
jgi:hypothetical protein